MHPLEISAKTLRVSNNDKAVPGSSQGHIYPAVIITEAELFSSDRRENNHFLFRALVAIY